MRYKDKIFFLIPAKNEEKNIKKVLLKFQKYGRSIVVNDHSNDDTLNISKRFAFKVLSMKKFKGYDASLKFGLRYIVKNLTGNYVITIDADGEHSPKFVTKLIKLAKKKKLVIGNRIQYNRWSEYICSYLSYFFFSIKDPLSGMKCYDLSFLKKNRKRILSRIDINKDQCGMFFFKIYNLDEISNISINTNKKNKPSSFGKGFLTNLKIIKFFLNSVL